MCTGASAPYHHRIYGHKEGSRCKRQDADSRFAWHKRRHHSKTRRSIITNFRSPEKRTVNTIEFFVSPPVAFSEDSILTKKFYDRLGLQFEGCKADTIRSTTAHPVTNHIKKDLTIEYRGCAIVEPRDAYEDISKYYYELVFFADEKEVTTKLDKVQLMLRVDK